MNVPFIVLAVLLGATWIVLFLVLRQQGRLLIRIEQLEDGPDRSDRSEALVLHTLGSRERSLSQSKVLRVGLRKGQTAPSFDLPEVHGRTVALDSYRGRPVLLVFTLPDCQPCDEVAARVASLCRDQPEHGAALIMISRGDPDLVKRKVYEHGLRCTVVTQRGWEVSKKYGIFEAPVAFFVDERGVIARDVARGFDEVAALADEVLTRPGKERDGTIVR